jgi:hypothetical protein
VIGIYRSTEWERIAQDIPQKAVNLLKNHGLSRVFYLYLKKKVSSRYLYGMIFLYRFKLGILGDFVNIIKVINISINTRGFI